MDWNDVDVNAIVKFCAEEVERQQDVPLAVWHMFNAWMEAVTVYENWKPRARSQVPGPDFLILMGHMVRPEKNPRDSFRTCGVRVGGRICPLPNEVPKKIDRWLAYVDEMTPEEAYKEFQLIHPFRDGNGRVGKIIFNWLKGTLDNPQMPPNFFGCLNP